MRWSQEYLGEEQSGRENTKCKGPVRGISLAHWRHRSIVSTRRQVPGRSGEAGGGRTMKKNLDFILSVPLAYRETKQASAWRHELGEGKVTEQTTL